MSTEYVLEGTAHSNVKLGIRWNAGPESVRWISIGARKAEFDITEIFEVQYGQIWGT